MDVLKNNRTLLLIEGILITLLGFVAVALPTISTLSTELFIGWFILFGGCVQAYRAFKNRNQEGVALTLATSILYIVFGLLLLIFPIEGVISLTLLLIFFFIIDGLAKIYLGVRWRHSRRWSLLVLNGVLSLIMAAIIISGWPGTAFWVLGLLVGINLIFFGITLAFFAYAIPKKDA
ncbi:MAG: HdeD family acid-resistance protein [Candidatus Protochlamydia sp.]|nr:HdeD family acid-resistance protein [Candidatus Protochlamydia sp.]